MESTSTIVLQASGICKSFGGHAALQNVDCTLFAGEVHALLGENGAGKSTLIKILTGAYTQDAGDVLLDGLAIKLNNPLHAQSVGIGAVYQEVNLLPNLTVAQNLFIGRQPTRFGFVNKSKLENDAKAFSSSMALKALM